VQVFLDGIPLNPDGSTTINLAEWPLHALSSVHLYRGNLPISFAAAPIGGAVNLVSHVAPPSASIRTTVGQFGTFRFNAMSSDVEEARDGLVMLDGFTTQGNFDYFDDNATPYNRMDDGIRPRDNNATRQLSGLGRCRLVVGRPVLTLLDAPMTRQEGLPGHSNTPASLANLHTTRNLLVGRARHIGNTFLSDTQAWHQLRHEQTDDRAGELGAGSQWSSQHTQSLGLLHNTTWLNDSYGPQLQGTLAIRRDWYTSLDKLTGEVPATPYRNALSLSTAAPWWPVKGKLYLYPALNVQLLQANLDQDLQGSSTVHPRLATASYLNRWLTLKANAGHFFRPPDYFELFGDRGAIVGNPELRPERSWQSDLGVRLSTTQAFFEAHLEATGFFNNYQDQIVYVQNAQRTMVPINLDESLVTGLETSVALALLETWDLNGSLTATHALNRSPDDAVFGNQLPSIPRLDVSVLTSVNWRSWARLGASWTYVDRTYWDATNWYPSAQRNFLGLFARASLPSHGLSVELDWMNLNNHIVQVVDRNPLDAGDSSQILAGVTDFVGYPLPGRTWYLELAWRPTHEE